MSRRLEPGRLVIASHNEGKVKEIRALLAPYGIEPVSAAELGLAEPAETEDSFAGNARIKAHAAAKGANMVALADDSGLMVDALGGAPGVYTADWAETPNGRDWMLAMSKVEAKLNELPSDASRAAQFVCTLVLAWPDGHDELFEGVAPGNLTWPPRGDKGFGFDPVFVPQGRALTFAEMDPAEKQAISHRADAFAKLVSAAMPAIG